MVARCTVAEGVVVAVEKKAEARVEDAVIRSEFLEDHFFKEPGRVRNIPFRRRNVDDRLGNIILDLQRFTQILGIFANTQVAVDKRLSVRTKRMNCLHSTIRTKKGGESKKFHKDEV